MNPVVKTLPLPAALDSLALPDLERNLFCSTDWVRVIYKTYRTKLFVKYIEDEGSRVRSYVFYSVIRNFLEWKICFLSYCDYCDGHVATPADWQAIISKLQEEYPGYRIAIRNLRDHIVRQCPPLTFVSREKFHLIDIRPEISELWKRAHDSFKAAVNQAQRNGVVVRVCDKADLPKFYDLHLKVRKNKYKVFPQPYRFFRMIWEEYMDKGNGILLGAFDPRGEFIGGNIYLVCGNTLYYKFNTSSLTALKYRPNNILFWEGMKYAKSRNLEFLDLGSSGLEQTGLIRFKEHAGGQPMEITHWNYNPPGYKFSHKRILRLMTTVFTQPWMPNALVKVGSHIIYPFLA